MGYYPVMCGGFAAGLREVRAEVPAAGLVMLSVCASV